MKSERRISRLSGGMIGLLAAIAIAIALNVIVHNLRLRKDITEERLYTLSEGTLDFLKSADRPITVKFFFSRSNREVPVPLKSYADRVLDILQELRLASRGKLIVQTFDPEPDSEDEDWARRYGLMGQPIGMMGTALYMGLVATVDNREESIPMLDPRQENRLEYDIVQLLTRVYDPHKPVVGVLSSLPVLGSPGRPSPMSPQPQPQPAWYAFGELRKDCEVRELQAPVNHIDDDIDLLIIVHPKNLPDETLYEIDQFVLRGGKLLVMVDPMCLEEMRAQSSPYMPFMPGGSNMKRLFDAWGVSFDDGKVVADLTASTYVRDMEGRPEQSPVWLSLRSRHMSRDEVVTADMDNIMLPFAGAFSIKPQEEVKTSPLLFSSENSCEIATMSARFRLEDVRKEFKKGMAKLNLAVRMTGIFKTAFPGGRPMPEQDPDKPQETPAPAGNGLAVGEKPATIVLVGDVDFVSDSFAIETANILGFQAHQFRNDNAPLFANIVDQLAGSEYLVKIRGRGKIDRPFEAVDRLRDKAQEKHIEEEKRLNEKLSETQQQLSKLQAQRKDQGQRFRPNPEQQKTIQKFQDQVIETRKQLSLVRRKLYADVERLGLIVKTTNILLMPLLVAIAGIMFWWIRKRKAARQTRGSAEK